MGDDGAGPCWVCGVVYRGLLLFDRVDCLVRGCYRFDIVAECEGGVYAEYHYLDDGGGGD